MSARLRRRFLKAAPRAGSAPPAPPQLKKGYSRFVSASTSSAIETVRSALANPVVDNAPF